MSIQSGSLSESNEVKSHWHALYPMTIWCEHVREMSLLFLSVIVCATLDRVSEAQLVSLEAAGLVASRD
jgi:hypothetical protein